MKRILKTFSFLFFALVLLFGGCDLNNNALSVSFQDISQIGADKSQIKINYQEEKDYKGKLTDILLKSSQEQTHLTFTIELGETYNLNLTLANTYYSLTKLISDINLKSADFINYEDAISKTFIISSNKPTELTFIAVVAELSQGEQLVNYFEVSRPFTINVPQKVD